MPNGGKRDRKEAAIMRREGVTPGVADLCLPWPKLDKSGAVLYCGLYIEVKAGKDELRPSQERFRAHCEKARYLFVVARTAQQGIDALLEYLGGQK